MPEPVIRSGNLFSRGIIMMKLFAASALLFICPAAWAQDFGADRHVQKGVPCQACHGKDNSVAYPNIDQCKQCHDTEQLADKTKNYKPRNPHTSPHYGTELDCVLCHLQHEKPTDYCAQCHNFNFKPR